MELTGDLRRLNVHLNSKEDSTGLVFTMFSMDKFGIADEVIKEILSYFGGYYLDSDTDENAEWTYVLSTASIQLTPVQQLEDKIY